MPFPLPDPQLPGNPQDALQSIQRNFDALSRADQGATIRAGAKTLTFDSATSATTTIDHGLGQAPTVVVATADNSTGTGDPWNVSVGSFTATSFQAQVTTTGWKDASTSTTAKVYWVAIAL
jgi:hypothetical protein